MESRTMVNSGGEWCIKRTVKILTYNFNGVVRAIFKAWFRFSNRLNGIRVSKMSI